MLFLPTRRYVSAVYAIWPCVCSVKATKHSQRRTIAYRDCSFLLPKMLVKFRWDHPQRWRQMQVG